MQARGTTIGNRLVLRTALSELGQLAAWVEEVSRHAGLTADMAFGLQLCIEEAVANVVMYGGAPDDSPIIVQIQQVRDGVTATIEDGAQPFDATQVPPRAIPESLDEARIGGLGVHLIRQYASEMRYERHQDRNRLTLEFSHSKAPAGWT